MQLKLDWKYIFAFIALNMVMGELHEQAHINTGFLVCGCYGPRDFNVWQTCENCSRPAWAWLATLAGPVFSCSLMWLGAWWFTKSGQFAQRAFGFSLLFANLPFARIFTAFTGGGDEKVVVRSLMNNDASPLIAKIMASVVVLLICLPPIIIVFKNLANKNRPWVIIGFAVVPLIYGMLYHHMFLNWVLKNGTGSDTLLLGTPNIILLHFVLMLIILILLRKRLMSAWSLKK